MSLPTATVSWFTVPTPLPIGAIRVGVTGDGVVAASFDTGVDGGVGTPPNGAGPNGTGPNGTGPEDLVRAGDEGKVALVTERLAEYFAGRRRALDLPIDWRLTNGPQRVVLQALQRHVGFGETIAYGELASRSGAFEDLSDPSLRMQAARAVGSIMGSNPVFLLVPCHRVVAADGLGGFGGGPLGMDVKRWLLTLEGVLAPTLDWNGPG